MEHILRCHEIIKTDFIRAHNCHLYDAAGRKYIDYESGIWCTVLGHNHPRIVQAMHAQLDQVIHLGTRYPNEITEQAAIQLLNTFGMPDGKCVFLSSGSEAVEFAVQAARLVSEKPGKTEFSRLLKLDTSYLAAYGSAGKKNSAEWVSFDWRECAHCPTSLDCIELCERFKAIPFEQIGGLVFETCSSLGLIHFPPRPVVKALVDKVKEHNGLLVANEVTSGMGRTGAWYGYQHYDLQPDIIAVGKGLGNGYPVSAVALSRAVASRLEESGLRYAQSHQNDPLGAAVALEVIQELREGGWVERGKQVGADLLRALQELKQNHASIIEARGRGMLVGLELADGGGRLSAKEAYHRLLERGLLVGYYPVGNLLRFDPALTIENEDIGQLVECLDQIL